MQAELVLTDEQLPADVIQAIKDGRKIEAIKMLREATGLGLANAKVLVDRASRVHGPKKTDALRRKRVVRKRQTGCFHYFCDDPGRRLLLHRHLINPRMRLSAQFCHEAELCLCLPGFRFIITQSGLA